MKTTSPLLAREILTETGWRTVAALVAEMQANGTKQIYIDRWLQGLERNHGRD